jgi:hypothetical protein
MRLRGVTANSLTARFKESQGNLSSRKSVRASEALMKLDFHPQTELELLEAALRSDLEVPGLGEGFTASISLYLDLCAILASSLRVGRSA